MGVCVGSYKENPLKGMLELPMKTHVDFTGTIPNRQLNEIANYDT